MSVGSTMVSWRLGGVDWMKVGIGRESRRPRGYVRVWWVFGVRVQDLGHTCSGSTWAGSASGLYLLLYAMVLLRIIRIRVKEG